MTRNTRLPAEFADLDPFAKAWALSTEKERYLKLMPTPIEELRAFVDAMLPRSEAIIAYLSRFPIDALPAEARVLYDLMVTFVECAHPIELNWKRPNMEDKLPPEKLQFHGPSDTPAFGV
jgi:hypothetical protein